MSDTCGCFFCLATFKPSAIHNWIDKKGTACCPKCGIDSVLPSAGVAITKEFLKAMHDYWFSVV